MAHYIQQLLKAKEPLFSHGLKQLERAAGNPAIDAKLIGDIHERAYAVLRKLGLDPSDTTREELWAALHGRLPKDTLGKSAYGGLIFAGSIISFNEHDVRANKKVAFKDRTTSNMRQAIAQELVKRYKKTGRVTDSQVKEWLTDAGVKERDLKDNEKGK